MTKAAESPRLIAENRKARFDYFIEERYEAGLVLQGWEVKAMRAGRAQLKEAYVFVRGAEAFLWCPDGAGDTQLTNSFLEKRLGVTATTRNWNTVTKLVALTGG